ncbi:aldo/keto reductase [Streptomyces tanashiensis]|uniref:aldo/keto reductase n=1 Tax=Streptomyces tanashiensis TaxID=67367 RepID=UPI0033FF0991
MTNNANSSDTTIFELGGDLPVRRVGYGTMRLADGPGDPTGPEARIWTAPASRAAAVGLLQEEGKVRHIGLSEVTVAQLEEAEAVAPIAAVQNLYNLATRDHEAVVDHTAGRGIAFVPFFPVAMGGHADPDGPVARVAREVGATPSQTALAWLLHRAPHILPIPGTSSAAHLVENLGALDVALTEEQFARLDREVGASSGS